MDVNEIVSELRRRSETKAIPRCSLCGAFADRSSCLLGRKTSCSREKDFEAGKTAPPIIMDHLLHEAANTIEQVCAELLECRSLEPVYTSPNYMAFRIHHNMRMRTRRKKVIFTIKPLRKKRYFY